MVSKTQKRSDEADMIEAKIQHIIEKEGDITSVFPIFSEDKTTLQIYLRKEYDNKKRTK